MKNILISGVAGLIGSTLLEKIIKNKNNNVIGLDNFVCGKKIYLKKYLHYKNFKFFKLDVSKKKLNIKARNIINNTKFDEIWLLAANSDIKKSNNSHIDFKNTYLTTYNLLNNLNNSLKKNSKIIFTSTSAVYGEKKNKIKEDSGPYLPISNYGAMKLSSEAYLSYFAKKK